MIFQHYNLVDRLSVIENVLHGQLGYKSIMVVLLAIILKKRRKKLSDSRNSRTYGTGI